MQPTLAVSPTKAAPGRSVSVSDAPNHTSYWWLATLAVLGSLLGGGANPPPSITAQVGNAPATSTISVSPASYSGQIVLGLVQDKFTPPSLTGSFVVPTVSRGIHKVQVVMSVTELGFTLFTTGTTTLDVT